MAVLQPVEAAAPRCGIGLRQTVVGPHQELQKYMQKTELSQGPWKMQDQQQGDMQLQKLVHGLHPEQLHGDFQCQQLQEETHTLDGGNKPPTEQDQMHGGLWRPALHRHHQDLHAVTCEVPPGEQHRHRHGEEGSLSDRQRKPRGHVQEVYRGQIQDKQGQSDTPLQEQSPPKQEQQQPPAPVHLLQEVKQPGPGGERKDQKHKSGALQDLHGQQQQQHMHQLRDQIHPLRQELAAEGQETQQQQVLETQAPEHLQRGDRYPRPLPTEEPPRRRAKSLPGQALLHLPGVGGRGEEEEGGALLHCCKKRVQFADSLGLRLASIKHFTPSEEPRVPPAVLSRLQGHGGRGEEEAAEGGGEAGRRFSSLQLHTPAPTPEELQGRLEAQRVCLEHVSASVCGVHGAVLVQEPPGGGVQEPPGGGVHVTVRYTFNDWLSYVDCPASAPLPDVSAQSPAPGAQRFLFTLCPPPAARCIQFAIRSSTGKGQEVWDNNQGSNYTLSCQQELPPEAQDSDTEQEGWGHTQDGYRHW